LIKSAQDNFKPVEIIEAGDVVGTYTTPWGASVQAIAAEDFTQSAWQGSPVSAHIKLKPVPQKITPRQVVGSLKSKTGGINVTLKTTAPEPSAWWRLTHPLD
jgi:serine-type D-Ala-D-Ala carboxypeptidase (penicillin-binding protein 5/6)